jgi:hypothetical protein
MMNRARGPVWHKKQKVAGIMPPRLRGVDRQATWSTSHADGWIYGHGSFCITTHRTPVLGCFMWMPNSGYEAKRMYEELAYYKNRLTHAVMDSKADSYPLFDDMRKNYRIRLVTRCRKNMNKTVERRRMIRAMATKLSKRYVKERGHTVEPMQGLVKELFDLDRCWMRGNDNNRWLFAAMGATVQIAQSHALKRHTSTWNIKHGVLGE